MTRNQNTPLFADDENEFSFELKIKHWIMRLNFYAALVALFFKNPFGHLVAAMVFALVSALGIVVFALQTFSARVGMDSIPDIVIIPVAFSFAILLTFGAIIAEVSRKKYKKEFYETANRRNYSKARKLYETTFGDAAFLLLFFFGFTDLTISVAGYASLLDLNSVFLAKVVNLQSIAKVIGVLAFASAPPVATNILSSLFAKGVDEDSNFKKVFTSYGNDFASFINTIR